MIAEAYRKYRGRLGLERREAVERALELLDGGARVVVVRAPTGYGKSLASVPLGLAAYNELWEEGLSKVVHVLPMSSITEDLYRRALERLAGGTSERGSDGGKDERQLRELEARLLGIYGRRWVGFQSWSIDADFKDPLFIYSSLIYTTFDSFVLNLFKVTPLRAERAPYESARAAIVRSVVFLDEAHLLAESSGGESKTFAAFLSTVESLASLGVPTLIVTATVPDALIRQIRFAADVKVTTALQAGCGYKPPPGEEVVYDYKPAGSVEVELKEVDPVKEAKEKNFKRALLVFNTVNRAIEAYKALREDFGDGVVLIHGRLSLGDRVAAVEKLDRAKVVVATQVVEAGVDLKGVDFMITDVAPLPSLIQRLGRAARGGGEAEVLINKSPEAKASAEVVYGEAPLAKTLELLDRSKGVNWRDPCPVGGGYGKLLEEYGNSLYSDVRYDVELRSALTSLNNIVLIHRQDAERYLRQFCGFVRSAAAVPLITSRRCLGGRDLRKCVLLISSDMLRKEYVVKDGRIQAVVELGAGDAEVLDRRCEKIGESLYLCDFDESLLFTRDEASCRKVLSLDYLASRELGARVVVVGIVVREGCYKEGLGLVCQTS